MKRIVAVITEPKKIEFVEEEIPVLGNHDVLLKTISVGLCHSELPAYYGASAFGVNELGYGSALAEVTYPVPIGHEPVFIVDETGKDVTAYKSGDYVTGCIFGSFATYSVAGDHSQMMKIPETTRPIDTCLGEPMMCISNIARAVDPKLGDRVAIVGCGFMGLMIIAAIRSKGLREIIAVDMDDSKLELAKKYGATRLMNPERENVERVSFDITDGKFYDCVVEITGNMKGLDTAIRLSKLPGRGRIIAASVYATDVWYPPMGFNLMYRSPEIHMVHPYYADDFMGVFRIGVESYIKGVIPVDEVITHRIPFSDMPKAFELLANSPSDYVKGMVVFS